MASLISYLSSSQRKELLEQLYYLNMAEYKSVCDKFKIPYHLHIELPGGRLKKTSVRDRKGIVIGRIKEYLLTGKLPQATVLSEKVVRLNEAAHFTKNSDRIFYGHYDKTDRQLMKLLKDLTAGQFKDGSIAREVLRDFWTKGQAPTLSQFAKAWLRAQADEDQEHPEWAFLTDRAKGVAGADWKTLRVKKAKAALQILRSL
ncbi:hypothetical protein [Bdellovibrio bacteriovorus]|uniref:hypothetical protein n=1 Tax=Bdellovibrio bacteriovorus TaxID=959 RepID=UPI0035A5D1E0